MRLFLAAHRVRPPLGAVPQAALLNHATAIFNHADLALDLVLDRGSDVAEAVDVFHFGLGAVLARALAHDAHVGVATE